MTVQELLQKYLPLAEQSAGLAPNSLNLFVGDQEITDSLDYAKSAIIANNFSVGGFRLGVGWLGMPLATWRMYEMPHCCGIIISCQSWINDKYRGRGLGQLLNQFRQNIARHLGYSLFFCTDIEANLPQRRLLKTAGFKDIYSFVNKRTRNLVHLSVIDL